MFSKKLLAGLLVLSFLPLAVFAVVWQLESNPFNPNLSHSAWEGRQNSRLLSGRREALLKDLTHSYLAANPDSQVQTVRGMELAPAKFLNRELERRRAGWRVEIVDGRVRFDEVS